MSSGQAQPALGDVIEELYGVLQQRKRDMPEDSYSAKLFGPDEDKVLKKVGEEATEVVMAAKDADADHLRYEIGDLLYHVLVVMVRWGIEPADIASELASRRR